MNLQPLRLKNTLAACLLLLSSVVHAQFWTENFNNGCTAACPGPGYTSANGTWTQTILGPEGADPNPWFVSCAEQNNGIGNCSSGCSGAGNASLHISAKLTSVVCPNDCGAAYDAGGLCGLLSCPQTNRRMESPTINCSGQSTIFINYSFIHRGAPGNDFASVWYFNGSTWSNLGPVPQSAITPSCSGQGTWSAANLVLPASANNNPNVKIGFSWVNNDDGAGNDPSIAIDDVTLTAATSTPVPVISLNLPSPVCQSNSINATFTSTTALTSFTWSASSPNVVFTPANSGTTTITFTGSGTYTISLTACQGANCGTGTSTIQVIPTPTLTVTASPTVVCTPGGSSTITASGGPSASSYTWTASSGPAIPNGSVTVVSPTVNTTYTVMTSVPGCTSTIVYTLPIATKPTLTVTPNSGICSGQSITLSAAGASTYTWSPAATLSSANGSTVSATPATTTTYSVSGHNGVCSNTAAVTVSVNASASVTISPNNPSICTGQSATLTATGGSTYTWTASSGTNPPGNAVITINPTTTTTYTLLTGSGSCTASAVSTVSVVPGVTLTATPASTSICTGGGVGLSASGASSYTWTPTAGLTPTTGANVTANPSSTTVYTVTGGNSACTASAAVTVSVTALSTSVAASSTNYCLGGAPVSLTASGATSYAWAPATGLSSTTGAVVSASPAVTTTYSVTGTSGSCSSTRTITVTVPPTSTINVASSGTVICAGSTTTLTASGAITYTWLPTNETTASIVANPSTTTTYTVGGQSAAGCLAVPAIVTVSVSPAINPLITAASTSVCLTETVALSVTPSGGSLTFTWSPAGAIQGPFNTAAVIGKPANTGITTYTVAVSNGVCIGTATVDIEAQLCTPPTATIQTLTNDSICTNGCVTFTAAVSGSQPMNYQWLFPGGTPPTSNLSNPQVCYGSKGSYSVGLVVTNAYGSFSVTANDFIHVADTPRVFNALHDTTLKVGQTAVLSANDGVGSSYYWYPNVNGSIACPTCSNTVVQPTVTTKYYIEVANSPYCKRRDSVLVKVDFVCGDFFVPNAFSPNGDGLNDQINVHGFCVATYVLQIFNRWGEKVFETTSMSESWDGSYQGKPLDTGVFVYRADGTTIDGKTFNIKGNITLIR